MEKIGIILLIVLLVVIIGCQEIKIEEEPSEDNKIISGGCISDDDCASAGCSGQLCLPKEKAGDIRTTCEYREEYGCLRLTSCSCNEGKCGWSESEEYKECLEEIK